jgi:hypothetical protein
MRTEIFIEGNQLDLDSAVVVDITKSIDDIREIGSRETAFTKTIKVPGTQQNNFVFGHIFSVDVFNIHNSGLANVGYNFNAAKNADCVILQDGAEVIRGSVRVLEIAVQGERITYEISVVGELGGLVLALGDAELTELDFSEHDHTYSVANIQGSWTAPAGAGYYYPLIDYGATTDGINFPISTIRPAMYVREYLDKIVKGAGYTWESQFFDQDHFTRLIIPNNKDGNYTSPLYSFFRKRNTSLASTGVQLVTYDESVGEQLLADIGGYITSARTNFSQKYNVQARVQVTGSPGTITAAIQIVRTSATLGNATFVVWSLTAGLFVDKTYTVDAGAIIELADGDSVRVELVKSSGSMSLAVDYLYFFGTGTPVLKVPIDINDTVYMREHIPTGIKQKDLLLAITRMFNLYIVEDPAIPKRLKFTPYPDFYQAASEAVTWTDMVDRAQETRIKPLGELAGRYYDFRYKQDADYYNDFYQKKYGRPYGTLIEDTGVEFLEQTQKVEVIFAPTPLVDIQNKGRLVPAIFKLNGTNVEAVGSVPRILYRAAAPVACTAWNIKDGAVTLATNTVYPYAGHLSQLDADALDLNWGAPEQIFFSFAQYPAAGLYSTYWRRYVLDISDKDSKLVSVYILLKPADMHSLDFSKYVQIGWQNFRINKVVDYRADRPTRVELLNVIYG